MMKLLLNTFRTMRNRFWLTGILVYSTTVSTMVMAEAKKPHEAFYFNVPTATNIANRGECMNRDRQKIDLALEIAQEWLALVDNARYLDSWSTAAVYFQNAITTEQWAKTLQSVREPLGKVISREVRSTECTNSLPGVPDGEYIVIQYQTSFEHKKSAVETVSLMLDRDNTWKVAGYFIK